MTTSSSLKRHPVSGWISLFVLLSLTLASPGYSWSWSYGRIKTNPDTHNAFETNQVPKNYTYYYLGRSNMPYVIVGLEPQYQLKSRLWRTVDPNSEDFRKMVEWTWSDSYNFPNTPRGKDVIGPDGNKLGIWYSSARWAAVRMLDAGTVMIAPDSPWMLGNR